MNQQEILYRFHRVSGDSSLIQNEIALRNALIDKLRSSGLEVITDVKEGQRILDIANEEIRGHRKKKSVNDTALPEQSSFKGTVVSFTDTANIQDNLERLSNQFEIIESTSNKEFISELGRALSATHQGSSSQYVTIEAKNETVVTIRLANHNATTSKFDNVGRENAISIVISRKSNEGITNDGRAHVTEYFYSDKKLRNAGGKAMADIARSLRQTLYSGEYIDLTGLAEIQEVNPEQLREFRVYHGDSVIFNESDIRITEHVRFFRSSKGESYGFTMNGKIYIDPRIATAETPIHEYTHLWADMVRRQDSGAWQDIVSLMKDTPVWETVRMQYPELTSTDDIADEVLARFSGQHGAARLRSVMDRVMKDKGVTIDSAALDAIRRVKEALKKFWEKVCSLLDIKSMNSEALADRVLSDLLDGVDLKKATVADIPGIRSEVLAAVKASGIDPGKVTKEQWTSLLKGRRTALGSGTGKLFMLAKAPVGYALKAVNTVNSLTRSAGMEM